MNPEHDVRVTNRQAEVPIDPEHFRATANRMLSHLNIASAEISVVFIDNPAMADLNWRFLQHEGPTDIITFPLSEPGEEPLEGELVISAPWAADVATRNGDKVSDELTLYLAHGLLHLAGQDDIAPDDAREMRQREMEMLKALSLAIPANRFDDVSPKGG